MPLIQTWRGRPAHSPLPGLVDWANPITKGLIRLYDFSKQGRDLTGRRQAPWQFPGMGRDSAEGDWNGMRVNLYTGATSGENVDQYITDAVSCLVVLKRNGAAAGSQFLFASTLADFGTYDFGFNEYSTLNESFAFYVNTGTGSAANTDNGEWVTRAQPYVFVGTYSNTDGYIRLYTKGDQRRQTAKTGSLVQSGGNVCAGYWGGNTRAPDVTLMLGGIWDRRLEPDEAKALCRTLEAPRQLIKREPLRIWVPAAATGPVLSNTNVTAVAGTTATINVTVTFP